MELCLKWEYDDWYGNAFESPDRPQRIMTRSYDRFYIRSHLCKTEWLASGSSNTNDKRRVYRILGDSYEVVSAKEMKALRLLDPSDTWCVQEMSAYRALGILAHKIKNGELPPHLMPRKPKFVPIHMTGPQNVIVDCRRLRLNNRSNKNVPYCIIPLFDKLHNPFGFEYKDTNGRWEHSMFTPMYVVDRKDSGNLYVYWAEGHSRLALRTVGTTRNYEKVLEIAQKHFAKNMLEHNYISEVMNREYVKVLADKCSTDELLSEIARYRCEILASFNDITSELKRNMVFTFTGKKE